jgi:hypothetical protein
MYYFCTYFDQHYLARGLALYRSLREHCPAFKLWVLCMDHATYQSLQKLGLPGLHPIALQEFERHDEPLQSAKQNRSRIEYYFTCTPSLPLYVFNNWPEVDLITYLDADLFFFASPVPLFEELGTGSIAIIGHRFPPHLLQNERYGIYNVGWLSFRRDENGLACLHWWREQCLEWCYDREEDGRFADQKYLDDWPRRFQNVVVLEHKGANVAPWNLANYRLYYLQGNTVTVDDQPLIFFHFHGLKRIATWLYDPNWKEYQLNPLSVPCRRIYSSYIRVLLDTSRHMLPVCAVHPISSMARRQATSTKCVSRTQYMVHRLGAVATISRNILSGRYIILFTAMSFFRSTNSV